MMFGVVFDDDFVLFVVCDFVFFSYGLMFFLEFDVLMDDWVVFFEYEVVGGVVVVFFCYVCVICICC